MGYAVLGSLLLLSAIQKLRISLHMDLNSGPWRISFNGFSSRTVIFKFYPNCLCRSYICRLNVMPKFVLFNKVMLAYSSLNISNWVWPAHTLSRGSVITPFLSYICVKKEIHCVFFCMSMVCSLINTVYLIITENIISLSAPTPVSTFFHNWTLGLVPMSSMPIFRGVVLW